MPLCYLVLKTFNGLILKLDNSLAAGADQMIMVLTSQLMFIAGLAIGQGHLASQTCIYEQLERTVNSSLSNAGVGSLDLKVQLLNTEMLMG